MNEIKEKWKSEMVKAIKETGEIMNLNLLDVEERLLMETPPNSELGDISFPMFSFAKDFKISPGEIAKKVIGNFNGSLKGELTIVGAYINIFLNREDLFDSVINKILVEKESYGSNNSLNGQRVMIEFSSPNTNKPLHLGHLRNNILGESTSRILKANGAEVEKVNLINNRGIHICKSMLAYMEFGNGATPESLGVKGDHFVGDYYVKFNNWAKEDETADKKAQELLQKWESGDEEVIKLWKQMNQWTLEGVAKTYERTGISFDRFYYESDTYLAGKDNVLKGYKDGIFYKDEDGSIRCDLQEIELDNKVLLRSDGTSVYVTQDLGTAIKRREDFEFNRLIYVVATEQDYHFKVLFYLLKKLGYEWSDKLHHLSYGMVVLPDGKMKSREGTVVDADTLLDDLEKLVTQEIKSRENNFTDDKITKTSHDIALAALNYYLLHISTYKDIMFNPKESLAFSGNTGPYMQYTGARISNMLRKFSLEDYSQFKFNPSLLKTIEEWDLIKLLSDYPKMVKIASRDLNPSILTSFLYDLSKSYSKFYHEHQILNNENRELVVSRICLSKALLQVLKNCFYLLNIPFLDEM